MLGDPHVKPLTDYVAKLRKRGPGEVPDFDPLDGGVNARVLFLFEKPGPKDRSRRRMGGSGHTESLADAGDKAIWQQLSAVPAVP